MYLDWINIFFNGNEKKTIIRVAKSDELSSFGQNWTWVNFKKRVWIDLEQVMSPPEYQRGRNNGRSSRLFIQRQLSPEVPTYPPPPLFCSLFVWILFGIESTIKRSLHLFFSAASGPRRYTGYEKNTIERKKRKNNGNEPKNDWEWKSRFLFYLLS